MCVQIKLEFMRIGDEANKWRMAANNFNWWKQQYQAEHVYVCTNACITGRLSICLSLHYVINSRSIFCMKRFSNKTKQTSNA